MPAKKIKVNFLVALCPIIAALTLYIYPLVIAIILLVNNKKFQNSGLAIATGVLSLFAITFLVAWILGFFLNSNESSNNANVRNVPFNDNNF